MMKLMMKPWGITARQYFCGAQRFPFPLIEFFGMSSRVTHREDGAPPGAQRAGKAGDEGGAHEGTEDPTGVVPETRRLVETAAARVASVERGSWGGPRDHDDERVAARSR